MFVWFSRLPFPFPSSLSLRNRSFPFSPLPPHLFPFVSSSCPLSSSLSPFLSPSHLSSTLSPLPSLPPGLLSLLSLPLTLLYLSSLSPSSLLPFLSLRRPSHPLSFLSSLSFVPLTLCPSFPLSPSSLPPFVLPFPLSPSSLSPSGLPFLSLLRPSHPLSFPPPLSFSSHHVLYAPSSQKWLAS